MLTDLLRINTSHITGLPQKYREKFPMRETVINEVIVQSMYTYSSVKLCSLLQLQ